MKAAQMDSKWRGQDMTLSIIYTWKKNKDRFDVFGLRTISPFKDILFFFNYLVVLLPL